MSATTQSATPRTIYYPALYLGVYATLREALSVMGYPAEHADEFVAKYEGWQTIFQHPGLPDIAAVLAPATGGGIEMRYLLGEGFNAPETAADEVAALREFATADRSEGGAGLLSCLHVVQRVIGAAGTVQ
jgi:hypothetical protein